MEREGSPGLRDQCLEQCQDGSLSRPLGDEAVSHQFNSQILLGTYYVLGCRVNIMMESDSPV